jgi:radical SAM protein with 4Fe4S-binding SPASM domain
MITTWGQLGRTLVGQAKKKRVPISGQFELTARCNLKCKMCYISRPSNDRDAISRERSAEEWINIASEAKKYGMLYLLLTGGEVFIRPDFKEIYEELSKMGFNIEIYTNATMITPEIAKWLGRIPPSKIGITLYGASSETYERICGLSDGYNRAVRGIDLLLAEGIKVWLKTTVIQGNASDFDEIAEFADERNLELSIVNYVTPRREGCSTCPETERLSPQELVEYEIHAGEYYKKKSLKTIDIQQIDECSYQDKYEEVLNETVNNTDPFNCLAGKCAFWVTWDGRMTPCASLDMPNAFPFDIGFNSSWNELQNLCSLIPVNSSCRQCSLKEYCMPCPARSKIETGFYDKPVPYLCSLAQNRKNLW